MIGLTATPASFIERDTYRVFGCDGSVPIFLYDFKQAINDKFLVDFSLYRAQTGFQRKGINGVELSEEDKNALVEQGIDSDAIDYAGTEIEKTVSNRDTLRKQWEEAMDACLKDQSGQLPGKTIVFAMTKDHAERTRVVRSASCSRSSRRLRKRRNECCSMASSGLESPPAQSLSQRESTLDRSVGEHDGKIYRTMAIAERCQDASKWPYILYFSVVLVYVSCNDLVYSALDSQGHQGQETFEKRQKTPHRKQNPKKMQPTLRNSVHMIRFS
jgi:hypothetical protein